MKKAIFLGALFTASALAQTVFDPTQNGAYPAYPAYLDHSCGGVSLTVYDQQGANYGVRAYTNCNGSGRGAKDRRYLACWTVTAADPYIITARRLDKYATWTQGQPAQSCEVIS